MENKISNQQILAKRYLEENNMEKIVSEMLNSLVHEKSKTPIVFMIKYLAGLLSEEEMAYHNLVIPGPFPKGKPIVKFPEISNKSDGTPSLLKMYLTKQNWAMQKYNRTKNNGTIMDVIRLGEIDYNHAIGVCLTDSDCLDQFCNLLDPIIKDVHNLFDKENSTLIKHGFIAGKKSILNEDSSNIQLKYFPFKELFNDNVKSFKIEFVRNIEDYSFPSLISNQKRINLLQNIKGAITAISGKESLLMKGKLITFTNSEEFLISDILKDIDINYEELMNYMTACNMNINWPEGRAVYISEFKDLIILINFTDHLRFIFSSSHLEDYFSFINNSYKIVKLFEDILKFEIHPQYGYVNSCISNIGAGIELSFTISLNMSIEKYINYFEFDKTTLDSNKTTLKIKSKFKLKNSSEFEFIKNQYQSIICLLNLSHKKEIMNNLNLKKIEFDEESGVSYLTYFNSYDDFEKKISPSGATINSLIMNIEPLNGFIFKEISDVLFFKKLVINFLKFQYKNSKMIVSQSEDLSVDIHKNTCLKQIKVKIRRNLEFSNFCCSQTPDNLNVSNLIKKFIKSQNFLTNIEIMDTLEYLATIENANESDPNFKIAANIHNSLVKNNSELEINPESKVIKYADYEIKNRLLSRFDYRDLKDFSLFINDLDHFRIEYVMDKKLISINSLKKILKMIGEFSQNLNFMFEPQIGYLSSISNYIGSGLAFYLKFQIDDIDSKKDKINNICNEYNYKSFTEKSSDHNLIVYCDSSNIINEIDHVKQLSQMINELILYIESEPEHAGNENNNYDKIDHLRKNDFDQNKEEINEKNQLNIKKYENNDEKISKKSSKSSRELNNNLETDKKSNENENLTDYGKNNLDINVKNNNGENKEEQLNNFDKNLESNNDDSSFKDKNFSDKSEIKDIERSNDISEKNSKVGNDDEN